MKKILAVGLSALCAAFAFAGGIENKTNMSTGYLRNPSRNTENKRPEAAFYNIAGTAFLKDGLHIELGNQFVVKEYKNTLKNDYVHPTLGTLVSSGDYNDETFVYLYPDADIVYKHGPFSVFGNFGIYAGGGNLEYSEGTAITALAFLKAASNPNYASYATQLIQIANNHSFKVSNITYGEQLGVAYNYDDFVSFGAAIRFLQGRQSMEISSDVPGLALLNGGDTISYDAKAFGISPVFGVHVKPMEELDISLQYQMKTKMKYELSNIKGKQAQVFGITDDATFNMDLSHALNFGVGYQALEPLYVSASFNYYINTDAKINTVLGENDYDNSFEIALGADYQINDMILASLGFAYGKQGINDDSNNVFNPVLDSFQVGGGVEVKPIEDLAITGGATWVKYFDADYGDYLKLSKSVFMFSLGATYRFGL